MFRVSDVTYQSCQSLATSCVPLRDRSCQNVDRPKQVRSSRFWSCTVIQIQSVHKLVPVPLCSSSLHVKIDDHLCTVCPPAFMLIWFVQQVRDTFRLIFWRLLPVITARGDRLRAMFIFVLCFGLNSIVITFCFSLSLGASQIYLIRQRGQIFQIHFFSRSFQHKSHILPSNRIDIFYINGQERL